MPIGMPSIGECGRLIGGRARAVEVEVDEGADLGFERRKIREAAFQEVARRVLAALEARGCRKERFG
jgi:hypothetical protein